MQRSRLRRAGGSALGSGWLLWWLPALAAPDRLEIGIDCAALEAERRAAIEARIRPDLLALGVHAGTLELACDGARASASFRAPGGATAHRFEPRVSDPALLVDQLVALGTRAAEPERSPEEAPPLPDRTPTRAKAEPAVIEVQAPEPPANETQRGRSPQLLVGATSELWLSDPRVALGLRGGGGLPIGSSVQLLGSAGFETTLSQPRGVGARHLLFGGELELSPRDFPTLALGAFASLMIFDAPREILPDNQASLLPMLSLRAGVPVAWQEHYLMLNAFLRAYERSRSVNVDGVEVLSMPVVTVGASIELRFDL